MRRESVVAGKEIAARIVRPSRASRKTPSRPNTRSRGKGEIESRRLCPTEAQRTGGREGDGATDLGWKRLDDDDDDDDDVDAGEGPDEQRGIDVEVATAHQR